MVETGRASDASGGPDDLERVVEEIRAEARRTRESGDYPATLERELDALFEDLVPERLNEHDFEAVLQRAERASLIDLHAPIEDQRRVYSQVKRGVQKLVLWYMDYVVRQIATFAASTTRAVRLLGERVERLEEEQTALARRVPDVSADFELLIRDLDPTSSWVDALVDVLRGARGRVLHAEAGEGGLVKRLKEAGVDAYGVDPSTEDDGLEVRAQGTLDHLLTVGEGSLGALVLSGVVDRATTAARIAIAERSGDVVASGGTVLVVGTSPEAWSREVPEAVVDLAPGRPFHAATWATLLERYGFTGIEVRQGDGEPTSYLVIARRS